MGQGTHPRRCGITLGGVSVIEAQGKEVKDGPSKQREQAEEGEMGTGLSVLVFASPRGA